MFLNAFDAIRSLEYNFEQNLSRKHRYVETIALFPLVYVVPATVLVICVSCWRRIKLKRSFLCHLNKFHFRVFVKLFYKKCTLHGRQDNSALDSYFRTSNISKMKSSVDKLKTLTKCDCRTTKTSSETSLPPVYSKLLVSLIKVMTWL